MKNAVIVTALITALCTVAFAVPVPINGDFEASSRDEAPGWVIDGPWRFAGNSPYNRSRRAAGIGRDSLVGDTLTSQSGVVVRSGQSVRFTGVYRGEAGLQVRLEVIGIDGAVIAQAGALQMSGADDWTPISHEFTIPGGLPATQLAYARVVLEVTRDHAEGDFDDLKFPDGETWPPPRAATTGDKDEEPPARYPIPPAPVNAMPNPSMRGAAAPHGWTDFGPAGTASWQPGSLSVQGGDEAAGWSAEIAEIDVSVPQRLSFTIDVSATSEQGPAPYAALLRHDPRRSKVYAHTLIPLEPGRHEVEVLVDSVEKLPARGAAQFLVVCPAGCTDRVTLSAPSLMADPHVPSVTAARRDFGIFEDGAQTSLYVRVPNAIDHVMEMVTHLKIEDADGASLSYEKRNMACGPRAVALFPVSAKLKRNGLYNLVMRVQTRDGSRDLVYGSYPFLVAPSNPNGPKNEQVVATITGTDIDEIQALATAGVGWVSADVDYPPGGTAPRLKALARDMATAASMARRYSVGYAVRIRLPGRTLPPPDEFDAFLSTFAGRLGSSADAYLIDAPAESFEADAGARTLAELGRLISRHAGGSTVIMVPYGVADRGFPADGAQRPEQFDDLEAISLDTPGDIDREPTDAGHDCAQPGFEPSTSPSPVDPSTGPVTPAAPPRRPAPGSGYSGAYEVLFAGSGRITGTWLGPTEVDRRPLEAAMLQACLDGFARGHILVTWAAIGPTRVLDDEGIATASWLALWNMARTLHGKQFSAPVESPTGTVALRFGGSDGDVVVIWSETPGTSVAVSGDLGRATLIDAFGGEDAPATTGRTTLTLGPEPTYVTLPSGGALTIIGAP